MATVDMNAIQFYDPYSTAPSLRARCSAMLQNHRQSTDCKMWDRVLEPYVQSLTTRKVTADKEDNPANNQASLIDDDDEFLSLDEIIRQAQLREDPTDKPTDSELVVQEPDKTSFLDGSRSSKPAQSSLLGHLGGSKEQPVILEDDGDNDGGDDNGDDNNGDDNNDIDEDSINSSSRDISSSSNAGDTSQELGLHSSPVTFYPSSRPSSSCDPSLHCSTALHNQSLKDRAVQQNDSYITCKRLEKPGCSTLILSDNKDDGIEKVRQQQIVKDREKEARNSEMSSSGSIDNDENHFQDNDECEGAPPAKQCELSPSYDPTIKSSYKRRLAHFDKSVLTIQPTQQRSQEIGNEKEQEVYDSNMGNSRRDSDHDHKDDQNSDDSDGPQLAKRRRPSPSSSYSTSKDNRKRRPQRPHISQSRQADAGVVLARGSDDYAQSQDNSTYLPMDGELISTTAEYQEWSIRGVLKRVTVGDEVRYGMDFSLEEPHAVTCPNHTVPQQSVDERDPQPSDSWDIHRITGMRKVDGVEQFRVAWAETWMPESDLGEARELVEEFKARLSVRQRTKNRQGKTDVTGEGPPKRRRGRPRKQP